MAIINCIIIIDDDPISAFLTKSVCDWANMALQVAVFSNALDALQFLKVYIKENGICPELIIVDILMDDINGFEFAEKFNLMPIKNKDRAILVGLSSQVREEWKSQPKNFKEILSKPFTVENAKRIMENYF